MKKLSVVFFAITLLMCLSIHALADGDVYVTFSGNCNVRDIPSLDGEVIGSASPRSKLSYAMDFLFDDRGVAWYAVYLDDEIGWVSSKYASVKGLYYALDKETPLAFDLDGDGVDEQIRPDGDNGMTIETEAGYDPVSFPCYDPKWVWFVDIDENGVVEILVSSDEASDDYYTECLHYAGGRLDKVPFSVNEWGGDGALGLARRIDSGVLTLYGIHETVGTYESYRDFKLVEGDHFEPANKGIYTFKYHKPEREIFDQLGVTVLVEIPFEGISGTRDGSLAPDDLIILTGTDCNSRLWFKARDGRCGIIALSMSPDKWGDMVLSIGERPINEALSGIFCAG